MPALQPPPLHDPPLSGSSSLFSASWLRFFTTFWQTKGVAVKTITLTGTQNDLVVGPYSVIRCNNASLLTITGLKGDSVDGQEVTLVSIGAGQVLLAHQNTGSTASRRLVNLATSASTPLAAGSGIATYLYDGATARWRLIVHDQGAWITPTFAAGDYTGSDAMTWTVDAADVAVQSYQLRGRQLHVSWYITTTSVGGTLSDRLEIGNGAWGGFLASDQALAFLMYNDAAAGNTAGFAEMNLAPSRISLRKFTGGNWTAATNTTAVYGQLTFEVD